MLSAVHQSSFLAVFWRPLETWTWRHRSVGTLAAALGAFALGTQAWLAIEAPYRARQREAIATLEKRLAQARATVAALPAARRRGEAAGQALSELTGPAVPSARVAELVARSQLQLMQLEPGAEPAAGSEEHAMRLQARGTYAAILHFAANLNTLPLAVVPDDTRIRHAGESLVFDVVLRVIGPQPAAAMPGEDHAALGADPFKQLGENGAGDAAPGRLVGILSLGPRRAALLSLPDDFMLVRVGDALAGMTVAHIGAKSITLAAAGASRTLALEEPER